ncbi:gustatory receptor for sugar taste 64f-like [Aricia agestis]|uniref:gustatory receptor for sugar taste 64f-like n=1 Tax=Aricia agestis TaxID=91739 RepID=UPI001C205FF4|nr:gustatory receptor for sugar taste 64f-like [Aricia agestis]
MAIAIEVKEGIKHSDLYRELEFVNVLPRIKQKKESFLKRLQAQAEARKSAQSSDQKPFYHIPKWIQMSKQVYSTQAQVFQASMRLMVICGQCVGLLPFVGVLEKDVDKIRYNRRSFRYVYSCGMCLAQSAALALSLYQLLRNSISVNKIVEHGLSIISTISDISDCYPPDHDHYRLFVEQSFPWLFKLGVTYNILLGIILPALNVLSTIIWSFSHLFIICISYFLSSILEQINKKIKANEGQYLPSTYWRDLREQYSGATRLVRAFDDVINNIVFASFASNLFFVCLRLYHILAFGIGLDKNEATVVISEYCPFYPTGIFGGHETLVYLLFSLAFVVLRFLAVSLVAARVHAASLVPAHSLYHVPSAAYCTEVERFIEQVHGDMVALSGLNFFYVTKELVLSVAGTIVTYELVLLQFNG